MLWCITLYLPQAVREQAEGRGEEAAKANGALESALLLVQELNSTRSDLATLRASSRAHGGPARGTPHPHFEHLLKLVTF